MTNMSEAELEPDKRRNGAGNALIKIFLILLVISVFLIRGHGEHDSVRR